MSSNKMKVITIDGRPYYIRLPFGGRGLGAIAKSEWNRACALGAISQDNTAFSWCMETPGNTNHRVVRGGEHGKEWNDLNSTALMADVGFRPVLIPLDLESLNPNLDAYKGHDGKIFSFGVLKLRHDGYITIVDDAPGPLIKWAAFDGKFIAVNVLTTSVSWDALNKMGFIPDVTDGSELFEQPRSTPARSRLAAALGVADDETIRINGGGFDTPWFKLNQGNSIKDIPCAAICWAIDNPQSLIRRPLFSDEALKICRKNDAKYVSRDVEGRDNFVCLWAEEPQLLENGAFAKGLLVDVVTDPHPYSLFPCLEPGTSLAVQNNK